MAACEWIRRGLAGVGLAALCASAQAQRAAQFPTATDRAGLVAWLRAETDITPAQVVAVSASAVTAVLGTIDTADPKGVRMALRAEAIDPQVSAREGVLSWHMQVEVDCPGHRLRPGPTTGYAGRNLLGEGREIRPGSETWSEPKPGAQLESIWRAACEPGFQRPLVAPRTVVAAKPPSVVSTPTRPAARPTLAPDAPPARSPASAASKKPPERPAAQSPTRLRAMAALSSPPAGPRRSAAVQVGALATRAAAEATLVNLRARFTETMSGLSTSVIPARVGGRTVYRALVTGFARPADASRLCAGMKAGGVACFVRN